jgi:hypothetical protein
MRRRIVALLVMAVMAVAMLTVMAAPAFAGGGGVCGDPSRACVSAGGGPTNPGTGGGGGVEAYTPGGTTFAAGTAYPPAGACAGAEHESYRSQSGSVDTFQCSFE